jgi:tetratricopeptide (TPR) repeat protein
MASRTEERADRMLSYVSFVSAGWLFVVTLLFLALAFFGWQELGLVRYAEKEATNAAKQATDASASANISGVEAAKAAAGVKEVEQKASEAVQRIERLDQEVVRALRDLPADQLPVLRLGVVGEPPRLPPIEQVARFEEADILAVMADKMKSVSADQLAILFVKVGYYWRRVRNNARAIARFQRAIELNPKSLDAYRGLSGTLYNEGAAPGVRPDLKESLLKDAEEICQKALRALRADLFTLM